jgi:hypothetical protein
LTRASFNPIDPKNSTPFFLAASARAREASSRADLSATNRVETSKSPVLPEEVVEVAAGDIMLYVSEISRGQKIRWMGGHTI